MTFGCGYGHANPFIFYSSYIYIYDSLVRNIQTIITYIKINKEKGKMNKMLYDSISLFVNQRQPSTLTTYLLKVFQNLNQ